MSWRDRYWRDPSEDDKSVDAPDVLAASDICCAASGMHESCGAAGVRGDARGVLADIGLSNSDCGVLTAASPTGDPWSQLSPTPASLLVHA